MSEPVAGRGPQGFLRDIVAADLASGACQRVVTRFPPEPNGYLHIGHAKSICLNFGLAEAFGGECHLRMDDSNPTTESLEFVEAITRDVHWLGLDWGGKVLFASDYFEQLYQHAVHLIETAKAYVCSLSEDEVRAYRGSVTEPGRPCPYRDRPVAESLALFARMRAGEFAEGEHVLRAKIDMASPNMKLRDPPIFRIKRAHHYRTADEWCIYPLYDFTHCLSDAIEGISHSICTLEFENNRELYDWVLAHCDVPSRPRQYEFARLNLSYTVMSKRKLAELVAGGHVDGWDDPRMPTLAGMRRRGYTPAAIRRFCEMIGVAKNNSTVDIGKLEFCIRDDLNQHAPRVMGVLRPIAVELTDFGATEVQWLDAPSFPPDVGKPGTRRVPLSRRIYIERDDFMLEPPKQFHRLAPGRVARLRYANRVVRCDEVTVGDDGEPSELRCSTVHGPDAEGVKGTLHWVSAPHALDCEVRLYDRLFDREHPAGLDDLNPHSLRVLQGCKIEPSVADAEPGAHLQLERQGYFCLDPVDSRPAALVLNRTVGLRDSWAKVAAAEPRPAPAVSPRPAAVDSPSPVTPKSAGEVDPVVSARAERYQAMGVATASAVLLAEDAATAVLFEQAAQRGDPRAIAKWMVNELRGIFAGRAIDTLDGARLAELVGMVESSAITAAVGKEVLARMVQTGEPAAAIVKALGAQRLGSRDELAPLVDQVLARHPDEVRRYREGKRQLLGFLLGQVMRASGGKASPELARTLLAERLG